MATLELSVLLDFMFEKTERMKAIAAVRDAAKDGALADILRIHTDFESQADAVLAHVRRMDNIKALSEAKRSQRNTRSRSRCSEPTKVDSSSCSPSRLFSRWPTLDFL